MRTKRKIRAHREFFWSVYLFFLLTLLLDALLSVNSVKYLLILTSKYSSGLKKYVILYIEDGALFYSVAVFVKLNLSRSANEAFRSLSAEPDKLLVCSYAAMGLIELFSENA